MELMLFVSQMPNTEAKDLGEARKYRKADKKKTEYVTAQIRPDGSVISPCARVRACRRFTGVPFPSLDVGTFIRLGSVREKQRSGPINRPRPATHSTRGS